MTAVARTATDQMPAPLHLPADTSRHVETLTRDIADLRRQLVREREATREAWGACDALRRDRFAAECELEASEEMRDLSSSLLAEAQAEIERLRSENTALKSGVLSMVLECWTVTVTGRSASQVADDLVDRGEVEDKTVIDVEFGVFDAEPTRDVEGGDA